MRSEKQYENFILEIEWRHMKAGGNSCVFIWSEGKGFKGKPLPRGVGGPDAGIAVAENSQ